MRIYLIRATNATDHDDDGNPLWWSNESGWSTIDEALVFSEQEYQTLKAPLGGEWVAFVEERNA